MIGTCVAAPRCMRPVGRIARIGVKLILACLVALAATLFFAPDFVPRLLGQPPAPSEIPVADDGSGAFRVQLVRPPTGYVIIPT